MLNSIPDPFDSYGPPIAEDEIFSILPPLAILNHAPSPSPSPLLNTPVAEQRQELDKTEPSQSHQSSVVPWIANTQHYSHFSSTEWADAVSPRSTSPPTVDSSIPTIKSARNISPAEMTRRHTDPVTSTSMKNGNHARKAEATLRSVLSVIDEGSGPSSITHIKEDTSDTTRDDDLSTESRSVRNTSSTTAVSSVIDDKGQDTGQSPVAVKSQTLQSRPFSPNSDSDDTIH